MILAFLSAHGSVAVAAHAYRYDVFIVLGALHAFAEEAVDHLLVLGIVPCSVFVAVACPLLVVARHGLVVGCSHDYAHLVGRPAVLWVVGVERPSPHCRPHEVAFEAEYQLENLCVEVVSAVICAESVFHPRRKARRLVVQENASVTHGRLAVGEHTFINIYAFVLFYRRVGPIVPRRHADLARQFVYSVNRSAPVAASNHYFFSHRGDDVFLTFAFERGLVYDLGLDHLVYFGRMPDGAHYDFRVGIAGCLNFDATHFVDVHSKIPRRYHHSFAVVAVHVDADFLLVV